MHGRGRKGEKERERERETQGGGGWERRKKRRKRGTQGVIDRWPRLTRALDTGLLRLESEKKWWDVQN